MLSFQVSLTKAKELLRNYTKAVTDTIRSLQRAHWPSFPQSALLEAAQKDLKDAQHALLTLDTSSSHMFHSFKLKPHNIPASSHRRLNFYTQMS